MPSLSNEELLAIFKKQHNVTFTRETFTQSEPAEDGTFVLAPDNSDSLPPIGCKVYVRGYNGQAWDTVVVDMDGAAGTYTAQIVNYIERRGTRSKRSLFGDHTDGMYDDGRTCGGEPVV